MTIDSAGGFPAMKRSACSTTHGAVRQMAKGLDEAESSNESDTMSIEPFGGGVTVSCGLSRLRLGDRDHLGKIEANRQLNACLCKRSRFP